MEDVHCVIDKTMVIQEPSVPSARLLGLGSKLYPSIKQHMRKKRRYSFHYSFHTRRAISTKSSSANVEERALGNPGARLSVFSKKTIKVLLIGPFKFARERLNVRRGWRVSRFFPRNVEVNTTGRFLISAIRKTTFARIIGQNYWIFQFFPIK